MDILIAEDEIYLAQSISNSLSEHIKNAEITMVTTINDAVSLDKNFRIVILSSVLEGDIYEIINKYKDATIILLVPYINHDTVTAPLNAGVDTYILKPFMIEELLRKINYHLEYKRLKRENQTYKSYVNMLFENYSLPDIDFENIEFPLFIKSSNSKLIELCAFEIAKHFNKPISFYNLKKEELNVIKKDSNILFLNNFKTLKSSSIAKLFDIISKKRAIIAIDEDSNFEHPNILHLPTQVEEVAQNTILSIEEYIKHIIKTYEKDYPDTELAKKLGISRKSLWEKRKKYGLNRKK
ncbi:MAG: hypothetical protein GXO40_00675 [Epsilonproteobacteria bacterium]|nr:hypothetical protein [Campylobacterota bacterium]